VKIHEFLRPEYTHDTRQVGEVWSPRHNRYAEGAQYLYCKGAHALTLFWAAPTPREMEGFHVRPAEFGLYTHGPAAFLLYKIQDVCEWSDLAFNVHLVPAAERELPVETPGDRARLRMTLVDASDGIIRAKRLLSLDKVMTQALRHVMEAQARSPFQRFLYDTAVQETYARFPDTDALAHAAEFMEPGLG
jgi:hypothetical protein